MTTKKSSAGAKTLTVKQAREFREQIYATKNRKRRPTHDFATPPEPAGDMVQVLDIASGHWLLEPSCGDGALIRAVLKWLDSKNEDRQGEDLTTVHIDAVEVDAINRVLAADIRHPHATIQVYHDNFLTWQAPRLYNRVLMNPPFNGSECIKHFNKAVSLLQKPFGRLVCVLPRVKLLDPSLREVIGNWAHEIWELPPDQFKESGVDKSNTVCIVLTVSRDHDMHKAWDAYPDGQISQALHYVLITESSDAYLCRRRRALLKRMNKRSTIEACVIAKTHVRALEVEITKRYREVWHLSDDEIWAYIRYITQDDASQSLEATDAEASEVDDESMQINTMALPEKPPTLL